MPWHVFSSEIGLTDRAELHKKVSALSGKHAKSFTCLVRGLEGPVSAHLRQEPADPDLPRAAVQDPREGNPKNEGKSAAYF